MHSYEWSEVSFLRYLKAERNKVHRAIIFEILTFKQFIIMKMKFLLVVLSVFWVVQPCLSQTDDKDCIVVHFSDDSFAVFPFTDNPKITFDEGVVQILTERYQLMNVRKYTFDNTGNVGIEDVVNNSGLTFSQDGNVITLSPKGKTVQLFSTSGIELPIKAKNNGNGMLSIDMSGYVSGVYMLSVGNESIKIKKK